MNHKYSFPLSLALTTLIAAAAVHASGDRLQVIAPYVRAVPPGQDQTAAYLVLRNSAEHQAALVAASSPAAHTTELHTTVKENGMMKMRPVTRIEIPAGGEVRLAPGGPHIMLIGLKEPLTEGKSVTLNLRFEDGTTRSVQAPVRAVMPGMNGMPMPHHAH